MDDYDGLDDMSEDERYQQSHRLSKRLYAIVDGYEEDKLSTGDVRHPIGTVLSIDFESFDAVPGHTYVTTVGFAGAVLVSDAVKRRARWSTPG